MTRRMVAGLPGPASVGAHAHVVVGDLDALVLADTDRHHLARVLRIRPGEPVTSTDGQGRWRAGRAPVGWPAAGDALEPDGPIIITAPHTPPITIGLALTKGDKPEWAVQKLTELGVDHVVLVAAANSVVRWEPSKVQRHLERLRMIALQALMQSRGVWLPTVDGVSTVARLVSENPAWALAEAGGPPPSLGFTKVLIGPEGGWSEEERAAVPRRVGLGDTVLRAETAALAGVTLLGALRARTVEPVPTGDPTQAETHAVN